LLILFVTGVSFWLYTTRVTTNRSFVALYNVNLGVLSNLFFHAFANLFSANTTLCVLLRPQQEKKKKTTQKKQTMDTLSCVSHRFILPLFYLGFSFLFYPCLSFAANSSLFSTDLMYLLLLSRVIKNNTKCD